MEGTDELSFIYMEAGHPPTRNSETFPMSKMNRENGHPSNKAESRGCCYKGRFESSINDIQSFAFWRAVFAEFLGTFLLVLYGTGATRQDWTPNSLDIVQIALSFGLAVATSVWIVGHISGGHINPAVTCAMLVTRRISAIKALLYIIAQCVGAVVASTLLKAVTPSSIAGSLGLTGLSPGITAEMGFVIEFFITFGLIATVFAACDSHRTDLGGSFPLAIGFAVSVGHFWAIEFTGSSMNPARSFGPAVVMGDWTNHWVYWVGPIAGGIVGAFFYDLILSSNASSAKTRDLFLASDFEDSRYPSQPTKVEPFSNDA